MEVVNLEELSQAKLYEFALEVQVQSILRPARSAGRLTERGFTPLGGTMTFQTRSIWLLVTLALSAVPAVAQESGPVEITPYVAFGTAGAAPVGAMVTFPVTATISAETEVSYRRGEGDLPAMSASLSLLKFLPKVGRATPYLVAGIGASQYGSAILSASGPPVGTVSRLAMTLNAGAGFKVPVSDSLDFRTDARWFQSIGVSGSEQFRIAQGVSFDVGPGK